jgi:hypothetical protein
VGEIVGFSRHDVGVVVCKLIHERKLLWVISQKKMACRALIVSAKVVITGVKDVVANNVDRAFVRPQGANNASFFGPFSVDGVRGTGTLDCRGANVASGSGGRNSGGCLLDRFGSISM